MRHYINANLKVIRNHNIKRKKILSKLNNLSIIEEFKEWNDETKQIEELVWTLPDLTIKDRLNNFRRSIKKQIK
tara:strand:- start:413 stop:634 length:222 start_codon:yes stop_codon:yes gene_type:complete